MLSIIFEQNVHLRCVYPASQTINFLPLYSELDGPKEALRTSVGQAKSRYNNIGRHVVKGSYTAYRII